MKRTRTQTSYETPSWFKLFLSTFCLAVFFGGAWLVSTSEVSSGGSKDDDAFSSEIPASYLRSSLAYRSGETYLDGRGRRFNGASVEDNSVFVVASHKGGAPVSEEPGKKNEIALNEQGAVFLDELEEGEEERLLVVEAPESQEAPVEFFDDAPSFAELAAPDLSSPGWKNNELDCDVKDLRAEWAKYDAAKGIRDSIFDDVDFDEQFDRSLVTDDLFHTNSTTKFFGETNAKEEDASEKRDVSESSEKKGKIAQVSGETPSRRLRIGRYVSQGAVGGSGDVVCPIN